MDIYFIVVDSHGTSQKGKYRFFMNNVILVIIKPRYIIYLSRYL